MTSSLLGVALSVAMIPPAAAQSPSVGPSAPPSVMASPASSATAPVDPAQAAALAACEGFMDAATLSAAFGQSGELTGASPWENLAGLPTQQTCGYQLADGTGFVLTSHWDITVPDGQSAAIKWGPANGGVEIAGVPGPAYGTTFPDGRRGLAWTPSMGPLLTLVLDVEGFLPDGSPPPMETLEAFARASSGRAVAAGPDPLCQARLDIPVVTTQRLDLAPGQVRCGYDLGGGKVLMLTLDQRSKADLPSCCTRVKSLAGGYAQPGLGRVTPWIIEWVLVPGDPATVARLENGSGATRLVGRKALVALAEQVSP